MLKNRINPLVCFGALILTVPVLLMGIILDELRRESFNLESVENWHIQIFIAAFFGFITSIALIFRWKIARLLTNILLIFISVIYGIFIIAELNTINSRDIMPIAISLFVYLIVLFCFLFINNEFIRLFFEKEAFIKEKEEEVKNILDA